MEKLSHAISIKRCKCMSGWMDGWMDRCGLLLEVMAFSLESSLSLFFSFETWLLLFSLSFVWVMFLLACHLFSFFWGNHNLTLFYFRDVLRESYQDMEHLLMGDGWMMVPNSWCRNIAKGWDVYMLMIEKA